MKLRVLFASVSVMGMVSTLQGSPSQVFGLLTGASESVGLILLGIAALATAGVIRRLGTLRSHQRGALAAAPERDLASISQAARDHIESVFAQHKVAAHS